MNQETIANRFNCPQWIKFLYETTNGDTVAIQQLQEFAGSCLAPETCWRKALILSGKGLGKTTFIKILREMVGIENTSSVPTDDFENQFSRAGLKDKWVNVSQLYREDNLENPSFLGIVTGDPIHASRRGEDSFTFAPCCKLIFEANHRVKRNCRSWGVQRRCICVPFDHQPAEPTMDLFKTLLKEIDGIRLWAEEGRENLNSQDCFTTRIASPHKPANPENKTTIQVETTEIPESFYKENLLRELHTMNQTLLILTNQLMA